MQTADVYIIEVGGTVGDIESLPFLEAIRQIRHDVGDENVMYVHLTLFPHLGAADELKTKPTQHSVRELRGIGISPDAIVVRTGRAWRITKTERKDRTVLRGVPPMPWSQNADASTIYRVPLNSKPRACRGRYQKAWAARATPLSSRNGRRWSSVSMRPAHRLRIRWSGNMSSSKTHTSQSTKRCTTPASITMASIEIVRVDSETIEEEGSGC